MAGKADSVSSVSASACHIGGPNSVNPGQILLVYGISSESSMFKLYCSANNFVREISFGHHVVIVPSIL